MGDLIGRLDGKVAPITGIGGGLGRASAPLFAGEGARVAGCDLDHEAAAGTEAGAQGRRRDDRDGRRRPSAVRHPLQRRHPWHHPHTGDGSVVRGPARVVHRCPRPDPPRTPGRRADVASVALFLASDESDYVNGANIVVDGGMSTLG
jgi:NAD(P)-dependent dehydrogenase (short-subunit alcohol dehydrogenase family)